MKRTLKQWKQIDIISQFSLLICMFLSIAIVSSYIGSVYSFLRFIPIFFFGLFAINQMGSFFLHRKYEPRYNSSNGRKIYFFLLIIHHVVAASLLLTGFLDVLWLSVYYLLYSAIVLSLLYLIISIYEIVSIKKKSNENLD